MDRQDAKHSSRIPGPVSSSHYNISKDALFHLNLCSGPDPQNWRSQGALLGWSAMQGWGRGEMVGGREENKNNNKTEKKKKSGGGRGEGKKPVRLACFFLLHHLFSVSRGGPQLLRHMEHKKTWQACFSWRRAEWTGGWWQLQRGECEPSALIGCSFPSHPASPSLTACTGCSEAPAMAEISACKYFN